MIPFTYVVVYSSIAFIALLLIRLFIQGGRFNKSTRCDGKVILITGANTGIGKETAQELLKRGGKVYIACRSLQKATQAKKELMEETGELDIHVRELDLSSLESVRNFAKRFLAEEPRLDILINNAGVMACPKTLTKDGFEMQFGVNHLGHFLLTNLLLDRLKASAPSRIVNLSSLAHKFGQINKDDLNSEKSYSELGAYNQSKLANLLFTKELAKRLEGSGVTTYAVHPGAVYTDLQRHFGTLFFLLDNFVVRSLMQFTFKTPKEGAQTSVYAALDEDLSNKTGRYYADCQEVKPSKAAENEETARWLWKVSEEMTGLSKKTS
ncbi:retinol dehydrogenase 12-like [Topomyia yanbarensis]|uniref:retinol dehydrogenase 12-like n=1 Tax=Topomyia yanbarensis TaxID=2498891 RepID=UPI00273C6D5A|nr:retinol dehydrogenase 12-like [Topomyia yanbarensis]